MISVIQLLQSPLMLLVLQGRRVEQAYGSMFHSPSITPLDCNMNFILLFAQAAQRDCRKMNFGKYISRPAVGGETRFSFGRRANRGFASPRVSGTPQTSGSCRDYGPGRTAYASIVQPLSIWSGA